jgi:intracellular sulfur oxidation DsrE/DsrF family protein
MSRRFCFSSFLCIALLVLVERLAVPCVMAQTFDDKAALAGLTEVKVAFDITAGEGKGLLNRLDVIDETRQSLIRQGVKPYFVLAFRGPATKLVQTDIEMVKPEDRPELAKIASKIQEMSAAQGIQSLEQCSVAIRQQGTAADKVLPPIKVVGNSWISLLAYQTKGYAYIAP